jgi:hypothetical protein
MDKTNTERVTLEIPAELWSQHELVAQTLGFANAADAAVAAISEWVSRRKAEIEDRDPAQRYFVNEALDELAGQSKSGKKNQGQ